MIGDKIDLDKLQKELTKEEGNPKWICIISQDSKFKRIWDRIMILLLFFTATYDCYRTAFFMSSEGGNLIFAIQTFIDFLFIIDIFVSFVTPFERHDGTFETNFKKISRNYSYGSLTFDLIAIIPF